MAVVQLADVYNPLLFAGGAQESSIILNRFLNSGVLLRNGQLDQDASAPGNIAEIAFYGPLAENEPNVSSDNPAVTSTPANITGTKMITRKLSKNQSWSTMDLAADLALQDPVGAITNRIGKYWATDAEQVVVNSLKGVIADNIVTNAGDMVNSVASESIAGQNAATLITDNNVIDTIQTAGDHGDFTMIVMHSVQFRALQKAKLLDVTPNTYSDGDAKNPVITTYLGMRVIVDDSACAPRAGTTDGFVYNVYLVKSGAFGLGVGSPKVPSELFRTPDAGNGGGQDTLYSRTQQIIHPMGFQFTSASIVGNSATYAELALAANWTRVVDRKNVGLAVLECN